MTKNQDDKDAAKARREVQKDKTDVGAPKPTQAEIDADERFAEEFRKAAGLDK